MTYVFYFFASLLLWQSFISLVGGVRFARYVRAQSRSPSSLFAPFASIVVPCRGVDEGLRENLHALWRQDYSRYELVFVFDDAADEAVRVIEDLRDELADDSNPVARVRLVTAGRATESGQKVHNLRAGVSEADARAEVFAFLDTDARPGESWLRSLVAPLADERVGAATGYRWFVARGNLSAHLRSVWNASITSALGADTRRNFCWGGSTAIRRKTFEELNVSERWRGTLSDDFALTSVLREARLPIVFVPRCLVPSYEDCSFASLLEFTTRQIKITRVYAPALWQIVLWSNLIFTLVFFGGIAFAMKRLAAGERLLTALILVALIYLLGAAKAYIRLRAVRGALAPGASGGSDATCAHVLLFPVTAIIYLGNAVAALFSRRIVWRGISYELKSANETAIIRDAPYTAPVVGSRHESDDVIP